MKIKRISVSVNENGLIESVKEFDCKKTASGYTVDTVSNFGGKTTRLKEDEILSVDTLMVKNLYHFIQFYTWYFESNEAQAKASVYEKLRETVIRQADTSQKLLTFLNP